MLALETKLRPMEENTLGYAVGGMRHEFGLSSTVPR